jgi:riboflavin kinase/FMN adenylyltransferase
VAILARKPWRRARTILLGWNVRFILTSPLNYLIRRGLLFPYQTFVNMQICLNPKNIEKEQVIALGNFDGVHVGHKAIIKKARHLAREKGAKLAVITFEPHPVHLFRPEKLPIRITSLKGKLKLLEKMGVDNYYILKFNRKFASLTAQEFMEKYLKNNHIVTGYDFVFGKGRSGTAEGLKAELGNNYTMVSQVEDKGVVYSSSKIRAALEVGDMETAKFLLGHNYFIEGRIKRGAGKGRELGYPTANIHLKPYIKRPKYGVYKVNTNFGAGVANLGVRPTLDGKTEVLEVHLFDFAGDLYGKIMEVDFIKFIRPEKQFASLQELKNQIESDVQNAKN